MNLDSSPGAAVPMEQRSENSVHSRRIVGLAQRRETPRFLICDPFMNLIFGSSEIDSLLSSRETLASLAPYCHESRTNKTIVFHVYDKETVLRIVPLSAGLSGCVAIFVDSFAHRGSIFEAAKTFGLTKRESEVLQLLLRGKANSEIADTLCVAEGTVGDHVKCVMRKMSVAKRGELVGKVFNLEHELTEHLA